jgi:hypothetical protein
MKRVAFVITAAAILVLCTVPQAQASSFMRINVDGTILTCDNSVACGAGFTTAIGSNTIQFNGTINGVVFGGGDVQGIQLVGNSPGNSMIAFILDTKTNISNQSGIPHTVTIDVGQSNFTQPIGTGFLSASQSANWTVSLAGDSQGMIAWLRNTNDFVIPGGTAVANSPMCISPGGLSQSCNSLTPDVATGPIAPYALTSREVLIMSPGTIFSGNGTVTLTAEPIRAPEPSSLLLLGTGILILAGWRNRNK